MRRALPLLMLMLLLPLLPISTAWAQEGPSATISCTLSGHLLAVEVSISIPEGIRLLTNITISIYRGPERYLLTWENSTQYWFSLPAWALVQQNVTALTNTTTSWLLTLDFSRASVGEWSAALVAHDVLGREITAFAKFTYLGFWASADLVKACLLYTSPSPRDGLLSRMPSSA